jgi:hypothetical protein
MVWFFGLFIHKTDDMKGSRSTNNQQSKQGMSHKPRPEIRDNLDSRKNEEQDFKGDDLTHNRKETHTAPSGQKTRNK